MSALFEKRKVAEYPQAPDMPMAVEGLDSTLFFVNYQGSTEVNYQINYAFGGDSYAYGFGDKLVLSTVTGLAYPKGDCESNLQSTPEAFVAFYNANKLAGPSDEPLRITVGGMVLSGFFTSLNIRMIGNSGNTQNAYTFTFSFLGRIS